MASSPSSTPQLSGTAGTICGNMSRTKKNRPKRRNAPEFEFLVNRRNAEGDGEDVEDKS